MTAFFAACWCLAALGALAWAAWFTSLSLDERKAILVELHHLRRVLDMNTEGRKAIRGQRTRADLILELTQELDLDHHAIKDVEFVDNS